METTLITLGIFAAIFLVVAIIVAFRFGKVEFILKAFGIQLKAKGQNKPSSDTFKSETQIKNAPTLPINSESHLSISAKELLIEAAKGGGEILYVQGYGGLTINAGGRKFIEPYNNPRSRAQWESALDELVKANYVKTGEMFYRLTAQGYAEADRLGAK
jgi:hypothetical protein